MRTIEIHDGTHQQSMQLEPDVFGQQNLDITPFKNLGWFSYDPGLTSTTACQSSITWLDGAQGRLLYRGYPIEQLASQTSFPEVMHLLVHGELPSESQRNHFETRLSEQQHLPDTALDLLKTLPSAAHPMSIIMTLLAQLSAYHHHADNDYNDPDVREHAAMTLMATIPTMVALANRHLQNLPTNMMHRHQGSYSARFTHDMLAQHADETPSSILADALDKIFILHADHELNASTFTVRSAGSTGTNPYACSSAGLAALWGPAHGGANEACLRMLQTIGSIQNIQTYIEKAKDKDDPFKLMGFGHRVYKNYDPRAKIMQKICHQVLANSPQQDHPLFDLARELERVALEDPYFIDKKLYPNIDFYSGITLRAMGIPTSMFTPIFALARMTGWMSHWLEMYHTKPFRITRPRQWYIGAQQRDVRTPHVASNETSN